MAVQVEVPPLGESITQAILVAWRKGDGETVAVDDELCELETDKANAPIYAKAAGVLHRLKDEGETVSVGEVIARIDSGPDAAPQRPAPAAASAAVAPDAAQPQDQPVAAAPAASADASRTVSSEQLSPAVRRIVEENQLDPRHIPPSGPGGRLTKEDVQKHLAARGDGGKPAPGAEEPAAVLEQPTPASVTTPAPIPQSDTPVMTFDPDGTRRVPMSKIRRRIAERLVQAQQTAAILTTFNEIDMTAVVDLRSRFKDQFEKVHGVGLGFMSFFARAVVMALREVPRLNAFIDGNDIVYHNFVHLGIAVSTDRGLAVPVLRNVQTMSFARIEAEIKRLAAATREGKLSVEELSGGTFSITNGGVFGSLLSTPILNPPQSGILGLHAIQKRAVVIDDKVTVRPMMYVALSYDHRIVDGREAITFLVRIKQMIEDPARLMLEI